MTKPITSGIRVGTLVALAGVCLSVKVMSTITSASIQPQDKQTTASQNEKPFDQAQALADLRKAIANQENKPAAEVFKNIQMLKAIPAGRLTSDTAAGWTWNSTASATKSWLCISAKPGD